MGNVNVIPADAFVMNCKMLFNDVGQMQGRLNRMWAASEGERDQAMLEYIEDMLENIEIELRSRLDS